MIRLQVTSSVFKLQLCLTFFLKTPVQIDLYLCSTDIFKAERCNHPLTKLSNLCLENFAYTLCSSILLSLLHYIQLNS